MSYFLAKLRINLSNHLPSKVMFAVRPFLTVQFFVFMLMGIINTAVSVITATLLDLANCYLLSEDNLIRVFAEHSRINFIVGYGISIITSFFLNSKFTFHQKPTLKRFIKFPISYIPNFVIQYIIVFIFTSFDLKSTIAYILAAIIGTPVTFAAMKLMIFRNKKKR